MPPKNTPSSSKQKRKQPPSATSQLENSLSAAEVQDSPTASKRAKTHGRRSSALTPTARRTRAEAHPAEADQDTALIDPGRPSPWDFGKAFTDNAPARATASTIISHSVEHDTGVVRLEIQSLDRRMTVTEFDFQAQAPDTLFQYYASFGVPREQTLGYDGYRVFAILNDRVVKGRARLLVHWVGYPADEATWEPPEVPRESNADIVDAYWEAKAGTPAKKKSESSHKQEDQASVKRKEKAQQAQAEDDAETAVDGTAEANSSGAVSHVALLLENVDDAKLERIRRVLEREVPDLRFSVLQTKP